MNIAKESNTISRSVLMSCEFEIIILYREIVDAFDILLHLSIFLILIFIFPDFFNLYNFRNNYRSLVSIEFIFAEQCRLRIFRKRNFICNTKIDKNISVPLVRKIPLGVHIHLYPLPVNVNFFCQLTNGIIDFSILVYNFVADRRHNFFI